MSKFGFDKQLRMLEEAKSDLPVLLGNKTQRFFLNAFREEGWKDGSFQHWAPRKDIRNDRNLLVKTGRLRRAVADSMREAGWNRIRFVVDVPYAEYQNEGTRTIPARKFMGDSKTLRKIQLDTIKREFNKILKNGR